LVFILVALYQEVWSHDVIPAQCATPVSVTKWNEVVNIVKSWCPSDDHWKNRLALWVINNTRHGLSCAQTSSLLSLFPLDDISWFLDFPPPISPVVYCQCHELTDNIISKSNAFHPNKLRTVSAYWVSVFANTVTDPENMNLFYEDLVAWNSMWAEQSSTAFFDNVVDYMEVKPCLNE